jgi:tetratricopeptide (TPR) repeat protein
MSDDLNSTDVFDIDEKGAFFTRLDWGAFWTACLVTFAVYVYTLAPTVTLEDSGELGVAGDYLGVPHPPGYPIWTIISWLFTKVFAFVTFRGQPNPAWSIGLVSAVFGALAAGITAMLICRSGRDMLVQSRGTLHQSDHDTSRAIAWIGGVSSSLLFAFTPAMWSQSTIIEVYSLNAFFLVFIFLLSYNWMSRPTDNLLYLTAFVFGLGLTNYQVLLLAMLPLVLVIMLRDPQLFRSLVIGAAPYAVVIYGIKEGHLPGISNPTHMECFLYMAMNFMTLAFVYFCIPRGRTVALTILSAQLGVAFYGYMPIVSDLRNPPMNWAYPRTWEGFMHAVTRGQYERLAPSDMVSLKFLRQLGSYLIDLRGQFTLPVAILGFLPFTVWQIKIGKRRWNALGFTIGLSLLSVLLLVLLGGSEDGSKAYKLPLAGVMLFLAVGGLTIVATQALELWDRFFTSLREKRYLDSSIYVLILASMLASLVAFLMLLIQLVKKISPQLAREGIPDSLASDLRFNIAILDIIIIGTIIAVPAIIWLVRSKKFELRMTMDSTSQKWFIATLSGFLVMSLLLIVLANPKGDVQDNFIQRVKFISSHALFAFWIGYGLVFGLAWADTVFKRIPVLRLLSLAVAIALPGIPLAQNAWNAELIRLSGGAEQNGHDFGWQFGNYQLRGADAVSEELGADEEPLPNPFYPEDMTQDAIFYGGTDPGRFVPTYMIYSARVREDVFLITQNALADNTYMNVMRDLYGDQIWIPAHQDSAKAFQIYVREVQSGVRKAHADLKVENGRVQVSGALGVMEINGILARMIFDYNNHKHDFYVEESYVIRWMYPFLTPHGLIMKINQEKTKLSAEMIRNDLTFWDWYTRRLHGNPKFRRDIVARKSFSKLRSAIAGLYSNRGKLAAAETAFKEARILYSLSPEANFRLVQEVYMRQGRFKDSTDLMYQFGAADPGNRRVPEFINHLDRIQKTNGDILALEKKRRDGSLDVQSAIQLAELYRAAQRVDHAMTIITQLIATPNLPSKAYYDSAILAHRAKRYDVMDKALVKCLASIPAGTIPSDLHLNMAKLYADAKNSQRMAQSLSEYLKQKPSDWKAWLDFAYVTLSMNQKQVAASALARARQAGGAEAEKTIRQDKRFAPLLKGTTPGGVAPRNRGELLNLPGVLPGNAKNR